MPLHFPDTSKIGTKEGIVGFEISLCYLVHYKRLKNRENTEVSNNIMHHCKPSLVRYDWFSVRPLSDLCMPSYNIFELKLLGRIQK